MQFNSLPAWLEWLEQCHPAEIDLGLERVKSVAQRLELLSPTALVVTVAGTNGKGSCVTATATLLQAAGHNVGVYTSPHLRFYNERIAVNGQPASDTEICAAFTSIYNACQSLTPKVSLTYFEYGTLAALEIFRRRQITAMVLEVGLGGRLDAVNIIDPDIAVITSIDLDHQDWLGDNREAIGYEKAGIMRAGRIAICADPEPPMSITAHAESIGAQLSLLGRDFGYSVTGDNWLWWSGNDVFYEQALPQLPLPSLAAALKVGSCLDICLADINAFHLLARLTMPGRFQTLTWHGRRVVLDVAHNPAATAYFANRLQANNDLVAFQAPRTYAIVAMMVDKERLKSLEPLVGIVTHWCLAELTGNSRAATSEQMRMDLVHLGVQDAFSGRVEECLRYVLDHSVSGDQILIFGSFYTVAAGLEALSI